MTVKAEGLYYVKEYIKLRIVLHSLIAV